MADWIQGTGTQQDPFTAFQFVPAYEMYSNYNNKYFQVGCDMRIDKKTLGDTEYSVTGVTAGHNMTVSMGILMSGGVTNPGTAEVTIQWDDGTQTGTQTVTMYIIAAPVTHTITATAGSGGTISPSGSVTVNDGASQTFSVSANSGYEISTILVDGSPI